MTVTTTRKDTKEETYKTTGERNIIPYLKNPGYNKYADNLVPIKHLRIS
jgi:hypothetical protein